MADQSSAFEWRRKRDRVDKLFERAEEAPQNLFNRRGLVTNSQKRKVYEEGLRGRAEILNAPGEHSLSEIQHNVGRFRVRVELAGEEPYEVKLTQSFGIGYEASVLKQGAVVEDHAGAALGQRAEALEGHDSPAGADRRRGAAREGQGAKGGLREARVEPRRRYRLAGLDRRAPRVGRGGPSVASPGTRRDVS